MPLRTESAFKEKGVRARRACLHWPLPARQQGRAAGLTASCARRCSRLRSLWRPGTTWSARARPGPGAPPAPVLARLGALLPASSRLGARAAARPSTPEPGQKVWKMGCALGKPAARHAPVTGLSRQRRSRRAPCLPPPPFRQSRGAAGRPATPRRRSASCRPTSSTWSPATVPRPAGRPSACPLLPLPKAAGCKAGPCGRRGATRAREAPSHRHFLRAWTLS